MSKVIIAGGRDLANPEYHDSKTCVEHIHWFHQCMSHVNMRFKAPWSIVSGGASGADSLAEAYAEKAGILIEVMRADWDRFKNSAGPIRNQEMANCADVLVALWDGKSRGTRDMIRKASKKGLEIHIYRYDW